MTPQRTATTQQILTVTSAVDSHDSSTHSDSHDSTTENHSSDNSRTDNSRSTTTNNSHDSSVVNNYYSSENPSAPVKIEDWARSGLTEEQIAHNMGIRRETLIDWKRKYPNISNTLKKGKEVVDIEVENALLKRALGYKFTEVTKERVIDYDPETGEATGSHLVVTNTTDTGCCIQSTTTGDSGQQHSFF